MTMSPREMEHKVRQLDNDVQSLYELVHSISTTQIRHTNRLNELQVQVAGVEDRLGARLDAHDARFDAHDARFDAIDEQLSEILRRLPG